MLLSCLCVIVLQCPGAGQAGLSAVQGVKSPAHGIGKGRDFFVPTQTYASVYEYFIIIKVHGGSKNAYLPNFQHLSISILTYHFIIIKYSASEGTTL